MLRQVYFFPATPELTAHVSQIPGALPTGDPNAWAVPAEGDAAAALLRFATEHDFDFVPQSSKVAAAIKRANNG